MPDNKSNISDKELYDVAKGIKTNISEGSIKINNNYESKLQENAPEAYGFGDSKYDTSDISITSLQEGELGHIRGEKQSLLNKAANGVIKSAAKIVPRTIEGIINPFYGSIAALTATDKDGDWDPDASKFWDNALTNGANAAGELLDKQLPLYSTKAMEDAHGFSKLLYANTLWGDVLDGMSYSVSAMASGNLTGKIVSLLGKTSAIGKASEFLGGLKSVDNSADAAKYVAGWENSLYNIKDGLQKGALSFVGASTEAADNALSDSKEWYKNMQSEIEKSQGFALTDSQKEWLDINRKQLGNTSFAMNIPVIMADNWITFGKSMLSKKSVEKELLKDVADKSIYDVTTNTYTKAIKSNVDKILEKTYRVRQFITPMITEGGQEVEQLGVTKGVQDYYTKKYYNPESASFLDSFGEGMSAAMSKEGLENFLIGAISSGIFGNAVKLKTEGVEGFKDQSDNVTNQAIKFLNDNKSKPVYKAMIDALHRHGNLSAEYDKAVEDNNNFEAMNKASDMLINHITSKIKTGKLDDFRKQLSSFNQLSPEEFETSYGVKLGTDELTGLKKSVESFVKPKMDAANSISQLHSSLENMFPDAPTNVKDRLLYAAFTLDDSSKRANELSNKVQKTLQDNQLRYGKKVMLGDQLISPDYMSLDSKSREEFKKAISNSDISPVDQELIVNNLNDIDKLDFRRQEFIKQYKELKNRKSWEKIVEKDEKVEEEVKEVVENPEENSEGNPDLDNQFNDETEEKDPEGINQETPGEVKNDMGKPIPLFDENGDINPIHEQRQPTNKSATVLNHTKEEITPSPIITPVANTEATTTKQDYLYPDTKTGMDNNEQRDQLTVATNGEVMSSKEVQELINSINKSGKNINDLITIEAVEFNGKKSIKLKVRDKVLGFFQDSKYNSNELNQLIDKIKIGDKLDNAKVKQLGIGLAISNGYVSVTNKSIELSKLSDIAKTNGSYVIFDQGTKKYRSEGNSPKMVSDGNGAIEIGDPESKLPEGKIRNLSRYVLAFVDKLSGVRKFVPLNPKTLEAKQVDKYLSELVKLSNAVAKGDEKGKFTDKQVDELNEKLNKDLFISLKKSEVKERSLDLHIDVEPKNGNIRITLDELNDNKYTTIKVFYIKNSELNNFTDNQDLLKYIGDSTFGHTGLTLDNNSFRKSIEKDELTGDIGSMFEAYTTPEILYNQDVIVTVNKVDEALNIITPDTKVEDKKEPIKAVETKTTESKAEKRAREKAERKASKPNTKPNTKGEAFKLSTTEATDKISKQELEEVERIIPQGIEVQTKKDLNEVLKNVRRDRTAWGYFKNKVIHLWTGAGSGTGYHEAFHAIFRYALTDEEVNRYLKLANKEILVKLNTKEKLEKALAETRNSSINYADLSNDQIYALMLEEYMADKFMEYKQNKDVKTSTGLKQLFKRLLDLVKNLFNINDELSALFDKIDQGAFSSTKAVSNNQAFVTEVAFKNLLSGDSSFMSSTKSKKMINTYAAKIKSLSRDKAKDISNEDQLEKLLDAREESLESTGFEYVDSLEDRALADKLETAINEELYTLTNPIAREILKEQVLKRLDMFDIKKEYDKEDENDNDDNNGGESGFGSKESWTISLEEGTSKVIREYIAFAMYDTIDELTNQPVKISVDAQVIYNGLGHVLANTPEDKMLDKFIAYAKDNEQAKAVLDMIMSDTGMEYNDNGIITNAKGNFNDLRKIIVAFKNSKITFLHTEFNPVYMSGVLSTSPVKVYNANKNTAEKLSIRDWANNYFQITKSNEITKDFWENRVLTATKAFRKDGKKTLTNDEIKDQIKIIKDAFDKLGIKLSSGYIRFSLLKYKQKFNSISEDQKIYLDNFTDIQPMDIGFFDNTSGYSFLNTVSKNKDPYGDKEGDKEGISSKLKAIANANGEFDESIAAANFKGADGNTRYDIVKGSYVLDETTRIHDKAYRDYLQEKYEVLKDNFLFKDDSLLNKLTISLIDGVRDHTYSENEGKVFGDFSEREYLMQHLGYWFAQKNNKVFTLFRQNEASNTAYVAEMPVNKFTDNNVVNDKAIDIVYDFFKSEYNRIGREQKKGLGNIKGYNDKETGRAFRFTEFTNLLSYLGPEKYNQITNSAKASLTISEFEDSIKEAIKANLQDQIEDFKKALVKNNLVTYEGNKLTTNLAIPNVKNGVSLSKEELNEEISNFYLNDYINSFSLNQLYDGDYALSREDKGVKEVVIDGVKVIVPKQDLSIDIVKRHKGAMGSGSDLGSSNHTVAFIKSIKTFVNGKKDGQLIRDSKGEAIDSNDAQSYTNINHIIFMTDRLGRLSNDVKTILRKIRRGIHITSDEQETLEGSQASLNPWKTVTFGREFYIKTSEAVISRHEVSAITDKDKYNSLMDELEILEDSKELTKGELIRINKQLVSLYKAVQGKEEYHRILNQMDIHGIDQVVAESASKGMTLSPVDSLSEDMDLSKSMIDIPNRYKRLQVETPTGKNVITSGTQLMQLIDSEQNDDELTSLKDPKGNYLSVGSVRKQYREAMATTRDNSFKLAEAYIKETKDGLDVSKLKVKFLKALESSGADDQLLEIFGLNWNLLPAVDKAEQLFLSHFGNGVLAQKVPGTKVSLMSDAHWNVVYDENNKVIMNKHVKEGKTGKGTRKLLHNTKDPITGKLYSECVLSERVFSKFGLRIGDEIPTEVAEMLGYRIPTQDKHSMISLRVVDILPNYLEGTGIFPAEIVLLSGADFDIDSLFIQQPSFWMKEGKAIKSGSETNNSDKWTSFLNYLGKNKLFQAELNDRKNNNIFFQDLNKIKKKNRTKDQAKELNLLKDSLRDSVLEHFKLPTNEADYIKALEEGKKLNNDSLNNEILDSELALLTNKGMRDIALTGVTSEPLVKEAEYIEELLSSNKNKVNSSSSLLGKLKSFVQNSSGKAGIGPVANALQAFTFLAKNNISKTKENIIIDGYTAKDFKYLNSNGERVADTLSTILSVMTDNAKDPIAGKMGLSLELLGTYNYLVSLGVPLRAITLIINTPSVQKYSQLLKENQYGLKTDAEKKGTRKEKLTKIFEEITGEKKIDLKKLQELYENSSIDTTQLEDVIKDGITPDNAELNLFILIKFMDIEREARYFQDLNNLIKLTKGLPTSFADTSKGLIDSLDKLHLSESYGLASSDDAHNTPFNVESAVKGDSLLDTNIKLALKVIDKSEKIFITETRPFKEEFKKITNNSKATLSKDNIKELKRSFLGYITTKAYVEWVKVNKGISDFNPINDELLFPALGGNTLGQQLTVLKVSTDESIRNNSFVRWLEPELNSNVNGAYEEVNEKAIFDKVSGKSFIKLSVESINDIVGSFQDLYLNPKTKQFAIDSFNYLLAKDNFEYRNDSFVKYIAPFMFDSVSAGLDSKLKELTLFGNTNEFKKDAANFRKLIASYKFTQDNYITKFKADKLNISFSKTKNSTVELTDNELNFTTSGYGNQLLDELGFETKSIFKEQQLTKPKVKKEVKEKVSSEDNLFKILDEINLFSNENQKEVEEFITKVFNTLITKAEASKAYRKLAAKYHPDVNNNTYATEISKYLNNAKDNFTPGAKANVSYEFFDNFDSEAWGSLTAYKFPEFILLKIGTETRLYYNDLKGQDSNYDIKATYTLLPSFGFKNITILNKSYEEALETYTKLGQIKDSSKKQDKEGNFDESENEGNPELSAAFLDNEDSPSIDEQKSKDLTQNKLQDSEKNTILNKDIVEPQGKPPIDLTGENNC